jgi:hypothetical protein
MQMPAIIFLSSYLRSLLHLFALTLSSLCVEGRVCLSQPTVEGKEDPNKTTANEQWLSSYIYISFAVIVVLYKSYNIVLILYMSKAVIILLSEINYAK